MTSMREKVARAVWERRRAFALTSAGIVLEQFDEQWGDTNAAEANDIYGEVDAVLDALMEPTEGMLADGLLAYELIGVAGGIINTAEDHITLILESMITAAKEGK